MNLPLISLLLVLVLLYLGVAYQLLLSNKNWESKLFWLLFILVPVAGPLIYLLAGIDYRRDAVRKALHGTMLALFEKEATPGMKAPEQPVEEVREEFRPLVRLLEKTLGANRLYGHNSLEIINSGLRKRELLLEDIRKAKKFIHIEYFKFGYDKAGREVRELLMQKAAEGVEVRFLRNNMANFFSIPVHYFTEMQEKGIEVQRYTHISYGLRTLIMRVNHQNHRKIVVIDGEVAYTGGMNLNDNYFYKWRDTHLRITGPAVARLQVTFIDAWLSCKGKLSRPLPWYFPQSIPESDAPLKDKLVQVITDAPENRWPSTLLAYSWILQNARDYVYIQTPYFMPPEEVLEALKSAALRGVDVRVMLPMNVDTPLIGPANRAFYEECLEAGVRICERDGVFVHSKTLVADDYLSVIGSSNLDVRSFSLNNEVNTLIYDRETALSNKAGFLADAASAREYSYPEWKARSRWKDLGSRAMRLLYKNL